MNTSTRNVFVFFGIISVLIFLFLWTLGPTAYTLLFSFVLAYLALPVINKLESMGVGRNLSAIIIILLLVLLGAVFGIVFLYRIFPEAKDLIKDIPTIILGVFNRVQSLLLEFDIRVDLNELKSRVLSILQESNFLMEVLNSVKKFFLNTVNLIVAIISLLMIPVFFVYLVDHVQDVQEFIVKLSPNSFKKKCKELIVKFDVVLSGYIRGQLVVAAGLMAMYSLGFSLFGLKYGFTLGIIAGIFSCVPYVGSSIAFLGALILILATHASLGTVLGVVATISIAQFVEGFILSPKIVGDKVGLTPLTAMLAIIVGANLLGFVGVVIALPVGGIFKIVINDLYHTYRRSKYYY